MPNRILALLIAAVAIVPTLVHAQRFPAQASAELCSSEFVALAYDSDLRQTILRSGTFSAGRWMERFVADYQEIRRIFPSPEQYQQRLQAIHAQRLNTEAAYRRLQADNSAEHLEKLREIIGWLDSADRLTRIQSIGGGILDPAGAQYVDCLRTQFAARLRAIGGESFYALDREELAQMVERQERR